MDTTRKLIPVIVFAAVTALGAVYGLYCVGLLLKAVFTSKEIVWVDFLMAEFWLLGAMVSWRRTRIALAIRNGKITKEQLRFKPGMMIRVLCLAAAVLVAFGYFVPFVLLMATPWWLRHVCGTISAVLMFCGFTYPWRRRNRMPPNTY